MNSRLELSPAVKKALENLESHGFKGYLIGGSVRDLIMGRAVGDIDITTDAEPFQILSVFKDCKTVETGIKHGTVTVFIDGIPCEITSFRQESIYSDNRHPDNVTFSKSLKDDVLRRDFTMNSIAADLRGNIVDLTDGKRDIENKIIRAVGNPLKRFQEDALRILRALRFSSVLSFTIEDDTKNALLKERERLKSISSERINTEFCKLLSGENAVEILREYHSVIEVFLPEIKKSVDFDQKNPHHIYTVFDHTLKALENSPQDLEIRLALLFHDLGKPMCARADEKGILHFKGHPKKSSLMADSIMKRLRFDNKTRENVLLLVNYHDTPITEEKNGEISKTKVKKLMSQLGADLCKKLITVKKCDNLAQNPRFYKGDGFYEEALKLVNEIIANKECLSISHLKINGSDLINIGFEGKEIGKMLKLCLENVMENKINNDKESLLTFAKEKKEL